MADHECPRHAREVGQWRHDRHRHGRQAGRGWNEERQWQTPPAIAAIDRDVGFIKDSLKFSYLLLRTDGRTIVTRSPQTFRVVSELRELKGEKRAWLRQYSQHPRARATTRWRSLAEMR